MLMKIFNNTGLNSYALLMLLSLASTACSIAEPELFYREARQQQLQRNVVQAGKFPRVYYSRANEQPGDTLHVYLGGDGVPWHYFAISEDPGPYAPLVLHLMKQDRSPSIFLGRPCYQGLANMPPCNNSHWTSARYSQEIVDSMLTALQHIVLRDRYKKVILIGFSGGGALAVLLARELQQTRAVVTIAGVLDTDAWTDFHHYIPLSASLNPARLTALPDTIRQIHIQGDQDVNVPPKLTAAYLQKQDNATVIRYPNADHTGPRY